MRAIFKRELKSYFTSPLGYVLLAGFFAFTALYFVAQNLFYFNNNMTYLYTFVITWLLLFYCPILTMRLFSEEKKLKTDQLLLTSRASVAQIVLGKYLSAVTFYAISMSSTLIFSIITFMYSETPAYGLTLGNLIAAMLVGMAFIAIGMFMSSLTESQLVAVFTTFGVVFLLLLLNVLASSLNNVTLSSILNWLSIHSRYSSFSQGLFDIPAAVYYLSVTALFIFLTARVIEKKRYS